MYVSAAVYVCLLVSPERFSHSNILLSLCSGQIFDKLCCSLGQDVLDALVGSLSTVPNILCSRVASDFLIATFYGSMCTDS